MYRKIIYRNAFNEVSVRELEVVHEDTQYIDAYCAISRSLKTFRKDRILENLVSFDESEALKKVAHYQAKYTISQHISYDRWMNREGKPEICFTGFKSKEKAELTQHATDNGFFVRTGVSSGLSFLVCGETAGPSKMKEARIQGAFLLGRDAYYRLAATGELPIE